MMNDRERIITKFNAEKDLGKVAQLWKESVGQHWPLSAERIERVLTEGPEPQHFVVCIDGELVGFVATFMGYRGQNRIGHLAALLVAPSWQGQGIGSALHNQAMEYLRGRGLNMFQLGAISPRFWCGVPDNLPHAVAFFRKRGWQYTNKVCDMVQDIRAFVPAESIVHRMLKEQIEIIPASREDISAVLAFEVREFPNWSRHFERCAALGDYQDILLARDNQGRIVGTLFMSSPRSHPQRYDVIWQGLLGEDAGGMAAVGVTATERGRGIGIGLVARATKILRERGVGTCYIDWIEITDFYARLGYGKWREYNLCWRNE